MNLWDPQSGELLRTLESNGGRIRIKSIAFDPRSGMLASAESRFLPLSNERRGTVALWDAQTGKLLRTLEGPRSCVDVVAFSAGGILASSSRDAINLLAPSKDAVVRLWNCETWEAVAEIQVPNHPQWDVPLVFHPTLPILAAGSLSEIHVWELDYGILLGR